MHCTCIHVSLPNCYSCHFSFLAAELLYAALGCVKPSDAHYGTLAQNFIFEVTGMSMIAKTSF